MSATRSFRLRIVALAGCAVLLTGIAAAIGAGTSAWGAQARKAVPTACPDTIACHALKRAAH